ncbi:hypothetical protein Mapa_009885 [Marchantia paleacea]|nr:hypothetical protein Mapa_009885 [Marchantia paleacea]
MAVGATRFKACRILHFLRHNCCVEQKVLGEAFYHGRGRSFWSSESSPYLYCGKQGPLYFEDVYIFLCEHTPICHPDGPSKLDGSPWNIHRQVTPAFVTRSRVGEVAKGPRKSWPWCWSGTIPTLSWPPADRVGGSLLMKKSRLSTLGLGILNRQALVAHEGHLHTFGGLIQSEESIASLNRVPREPVLEGTRTWNGVLHVHSRLMDGDPIASPDVRTGARRQRKSRTDICDGGAKLRTTLTPSYFIQLLQRQKDPNLALKLFKWAEGQSGFKHTPGTYCALIKALGFSKSFSTVKQLKKELELKGLASSTLVLRTLAVTFCQGGMTEETIECLKRMEDLGCRPRLSLYNSLMHVFIKADCPYGAHFLYQRMLDAGCRPDSCTFNNLLVGMSGSLVNMQRVLEEMKQQSCKPTAVTIAILLNILCKAGKLDEAWSLFAANKDLANVVVTNTMIHGLCKVGRIELALKLFQEMKEKKLRLQTATFNILIHGLGLARRTEDALRLFRSMVDWEMVPDVLTYNVALRILIKDGRLHEACRLFERMVTENLSPDGITYGTLIDGFCEEGDLDSACKLLMTMQGSCFKAYKVDSSRAHCKAKEGDDGVLRSTESKRTGLRVERAVYTALCAELFKAGRFSEAYEVFRETAKSDPGLYLFAYNAAIHGFGKAGDVDKAWNLFQSMSERGCKPDVVTYNTLISSFGKAKQVDRACDLFLDMQVLGIKPDVVTCTTLVDALCKSNRVQTALEMFEEMQVQGISPNVLTCHALFDGFCKEGHLKRAHMLYEDMMNKPCLLSEVMYRSLIRGFSNSAHLVNESYRLYIEMSEKGYRSDPLTSYMLMRSLRRAGKTDEALEIVSMSSRKRTV